ncbi:MAG: ABC transporter ATP-binding protein, partial [Chloroflexi bacterium]|nr:ABC transporter ATP-binding protein [Chloroflexota bacterium]
MSSLRSLMRYLRPYVRRALLAVLLLLGVVATDLAIPRLVQRIIDVGVARGDLGTVMTTSLAMIMASLASAMMAVGNTVLAVRVAQYYGADL